MKNVKRNQGQWKRLTAILIVAVMLFTTPHIVGFASMSSEEAVTTSAAKTGMAEQGEEQNTGDKSVQTEEAGAQEAENVKFFCNIFSKKFLTLFTCYSLFIMT